MATSNKKTGGGVRTALRNIKPGFSISRNPLAERIKKLEPSSTNQVPLTWHKAKNFSLWDEGGNKWIDLTSGIFVANAGHSNPAIKKALKKQLDGDLIFAYNYPTRIRERLETKILSLSPKHLNAITLLNSGSESMGLIYKLLKQYGQKTGKRYIVTFKGNFHGRGLGSDFISGSKEKAAWSRLEDPDVIFLDFPYEASAQFDPSLLPKESEIAGFVLETFQGWGAWFYPKPFIHALASFAKESGALLCFDEMQAGFYRLGPLFGYQTYGDLKPDVLALGKGISSSLPISAVLARRELFDMSGHADQYGTHSGNAFCCAAALASVDFLSSRAEVKRRTVTMPVFEKEMLSLEKFPQVKRVNVRGLMAGIIFYEAGEATETVFECIRRGVLPVCTNRNSIKVGPPLTITPNAIREAIQVLREILTERSGSSS